MSAHADPRPGGAARLAVTASPILGPTIRARLWASRGTTVALQAIVVLAILAAWQLAAATGNLDKEVLSDPVDVTARIVSMLAGEDVFGYTIYAHIWQTLQELIVGYVIGSVAGIALGVAFARASVLPRVFQPYILSVYSIPKIALAPLFVLLFGIGIVSKVAIVAVGVFFMLFFNTFAGILNVEPEFVNIARIMGADERRVFFRVVWPAALPSVFTGFKLGVPFAMVGAMVGEFIAAFQGIGYVILQATTRYDPSAMFAGIVFLVVLVWAFGQLVGLVESRLLRWQPKRQAEANVSV